MPDRPRLLDLFCGEGGASMGYARAGFEVVGVDSEPQPRYPFEFVRADAMTYPLGGFDAVHASPPCQAFSITRSLWKDREHPELIEATRDRLREWGGVYVIENVPGAPLLQPVLLCGSMFGLHVRRHRLFESPVSFLVPSCQHGLQTPRFLVQRGRGAARRSRLASVTVAGHGTEAVDVGSHYLASVVHVFGSDGGKGGVALWREAMGIEWMSRAGLAQAIPPAYTELLGWQLRAALDAAAALSASERA